MVLETISDETSAEAEKVNRKRKLSEVVESSKMQRLDVEENEGSRSEIQHGWSFHKETSEKKKGDFVEDLPELQLGQVLKELKIVELLKAEGVSKKWQSAAIFFAWPAIHEISPENMCQKQDKPLIMDKEKLRFLLKRCGRAVWKLDLSGSLEVFSHRIARMMVPLAPPNLTHLGLSGIRLTKMAPRALIPLGPKLKTIDFGNMSMNRTTMEGVAELVGACPVLENLFLGDNKCLIPDHLFESLPPTLRCLHISHIPNGRDVPPPFPQLSLIGERCPQLVEFRIWKAEGSWRYGRTTIPDDAFDFLRRLNRSLNILELGRIDSESALSAVQQLTNLTYLKIDWSCTYLLSAEFCRNCTELHTIYADRCLLEDDALLALAHHRKLQKLELVYCSRVTNEGIQAVIENCPDLKHVNVWQCTEVNEGTMKIWFDEFKERQPADRQMFPTISWTRPNSARR